MQRHRKVTYDPSSKRRNLCLKNQDRSPVFCAGPTVKKPSPNCEAFRARMQVDAEDQSIQEISRDPSPRPRDLPENSRHIPCSYLWVRSRKPPLRKPSRSHTGLLPRLIHRLAAICSPALRGHFSLGLCVHVHVALSVLRGPRPVLAYRSAQ